tara:strand:+ start:5362 stop:6633 length:1272 start_codon:yes stop_codon:yes gene_type:complete
MKNPFISFVIPTRDRPDLIEYTLRSFSLQTSKDFEVILSDNFTSKPCKKVFDKYKSKNFRYLHPSKPLSMLDNWEFALQHCRGDYVSFLTDKYMVYSETVEKLINLCTEYNELPDIVSWLSDVTMPIRKNDFESVRFYKFLPTRETENFDPIEELKRKRKKIYADIDKNGYPGWYRGKITSGMYSRKLIEKIINKHSKLFPPIFPDQSSLALGLANAEICIDYGKPLVQHLSIDGNGKTMRRTANGHMDYINENCSDLNINDLPIPGLHTSITNIEVYDWYANERIKSKLNYSDVDFELLVKLSEEYHNEINWTDLSVKHDQVDLLKNFKRKNEIDNYKNTKSTNRNFQLFLIKVTKLISRIDFLNLIRSIKDIFSSSTGGKRWSTFKILDDFHIIKKNKNHSWKSFKLNWILKKTLGLNILK